jgi:hypothetical protein
MVRDGGGLVKPNIALMLVDNFGYSVIGCCGGGE